MRKLRPFDGGDASHSGAVLQRAAIAVTLQ